MTPYVVLLIGFAVQAFLLAVVILLLLRLAALEVSQGRLLSILKGNPEAYGVAADMIFNYACVHQDANHDPCFCQELFALAKTVRGKAVKP